jgi:hypothetical protein
MRKRITEPRQTQTLDEPDQGWLDLDPIATIEVTSEDPKFPIESVFGPSDGRGWRAAEPGEQTIRIIFDAPRSLHRIQLKFHDADTERTQQFTLRWSRRSGPPTEIVRQQWNFSPEGSTSEIENYSVNLADVSILELTIRPDLTRRDVYATLESWRLR